MGELDDLMLTFSMIIIRKSDGEECRVVKMLFTIEEQKIWIKPVGKGKGKPQAYDIRDIEQLFQNKE